MTEKNQDKNTLRRVLRIDELISSGCYPSAERLMRDEQIETSRSNFFRIMQYMRDELHAPIEFDKERKGYYYTDSTFRIPRIWTTEQELQAVEILKNLIATVKGTPVYDNAQAILNLIESSPVKNPNENLFGEEGKSKAAKDFSAQNEITVFLDDFHVNINEDVWKNIFDAIKNHRMIKFEYQKSKDAPREKRTVEPYQIINSKNHWYLWCNDIDRKDFRIFTMSKISNVEIAKKSFKFPKNYEAKNYFFSELGIHYNKTQYDFKIKFFRGEPHPQKFIVGHTFGKNQKIEWEGNDLILSFTASQFDDVLKLVLSYGSKAQPLAPQKLVKAWKAEIEKMGKMIK